MKQWSRSLTKKIVYDQRTEEDEEGSHVDIWGKTCLNKGTASIKALRWKHFLISLRKSKEVVMAGVKGIIGRIVDHGVKEVMGW